MSRYIEYLEGIGLGDAALEATGEFAKAAASESVKYIAGEALGRVGEIFAEEALKAAVGAFAVPLLKALLGVSDKTLVRIDKLVQAPFKTGTRAAIDALKLPAANPEEFAFRGNRLQFAIDQLEIAAVLIPGTKSEAEDKFYIRLLQGLCAELVSGGKQYAKQRLAECVKALELEQQELRNEIQRESESGQRSAIAADSVLWGKSGLSREDRPTAVYVELARRAERAEARARWLSHQVSLAETLLHRLRLTISEG